METSITIHTLIRKKGDDAAHLQSISTAPALTVIGQHPCVMCIKHEHGTKSHLQIKICMYPPRNSKVISHRKFYSRG